MVSKEIINKVINEIISLKCTDYPKAIALKNFNEEDYVGETYPDGVSPNVYEEFWNPSPVGNLQKAQEDLTSKIEFDLLEYGSAYAWNTFCYYAFNTYLYKSDGWKEKLEEWGFDSKLNFDYQTFGLQNIAQWFNSESIPINLPNMCDALSRVIDKSPRLQENTVLYRLGELPIDINVGGHGKWDGFVSTTYNPYYVDYLKKNGGISEKEDMDKKYVIKVYAPKGTKSAVFQQSLNCDRESELLLDKGQRYIVLAKDDENMTADILLY